jgi:hypothetical protein
VFLENIHPDRRQSYITCILQTYNESGKRDWRTKEILAKNLHKLIELFPKQTVENEFLPMFYKFLEERIATVNESAATAAASLLLKFSGDSKF